MILIINTYALGQDKIGACIGRIDEKGMGKVVHLVFDGEQAEIVKQFVGTLDGGLMDKMESMGAGKVTFDALTLAQQQFYMQALLSDEITT